VRIAVALFGILVCCAPPATEARVAPVPAEPVLIRFALPTSLPARYLRTLEHDPGGYDSDSPPGGPVRDGPSALLLGDLLFHAPSILGAPARALGISCQSCHPNGAAHVTFHVDGVGGAPGSVDLTASFFRLGADDKVDDPINIPSLRGARFTAPYGHDGRTASLAEFVQSVVTEEFGGPPLSTRELAALVRYVQDLDFLPNANLDSRSRLAPRASAAAKRGEAIFARPQPGFGGGSCATCHVPSTFFRDGRVHRLGWTEPAVPSALDDGEETPTLLGTRETAPYFHDGRLPTLGAVVQWFDLSYRLGLNASERDDLTSYLDAVGATDRVDDDRPLARKLSQTYAYAALAGDADLLVRRAAIEAVLVALQEPPPGMIERVAPMAVRVRSLRVDGGPVPASELRPLVRELTRLAADWAGAIAP
jgi:hypothetical protein